MGVGIGFGRTPASPVQVLTPRTGHADGLPVGDGHSFWPGRWPQEHASEWPRLAADRTSLGNCLAPLRG